MRWVIALSTLLLAAGCGEDRSRTAVVPQQIAVSADRLTVEVQTAYPTNSGCAKEPGGLSIDVANGVATFTAIVENSTGATECTLECGQVWQSVSLDEPLPGPVRFTYPADANPGCGGISPPVTTTNPPLATLPCPPVSAPTRDFDPSAIPTPPLQTAGLDRSEFGSDVIEALAPMAIGADAGTIVANLRGAGWTVTVVLRSATTTTATPDTSWSRLVVTVCDGVVDEITFD